MRMTCEMEETLKSNHTIVKHHKGMEILLLIATLGS